MRVTRPAVTAAALALGLLAAPLALQAQQGGRVWRIGYFGGTTPAASASYVEAFRQRLRELGYVEGQNITIEYQWAHGKIPESVRIRVDEVIE
jgi:putative ABC transport system substrate-binding protein